MIYKCDFDLKRQGTPIPPPPLYLTSYPIDITSFREEFIRNMEEGVVLEVRVSRFQEFFTISWLWDFE